MVDFDYHSCKCGLLTVNGSRLVECLVCRTLTSYPYSPIRKGPRMIRVQLPMLLLGISFQREYVNARTPKGHGPNIELRSTACELHRLNKEGKSEAIISRGYCRCDSRDNFTLEKGRKTALARALKLLQLRKEDRTTLWHTYLDRPRPKSVQNRPAVKLQPEIIEGEVVEERIKRIIAEPASPLRDATHLIFAPEPGDRFKRALVDALPRSVPDATGTTEDFHAGEI